jgi:hypothetical protein
MLRKHTQLIELCDNGDGNTPTSINQYVTPLGEPQAGDVLRYEEIIDNRFTDMSKVVQHVVKVDPSTPTKLTVNVALQPGARGNFKAVYLVWWEKSASPPPPPPSPTTGSKEPLPAEPPVCARKPYLPTCDRASDD